ACDTDLQFAELNGPAALAGAVEFGRECRPVGDRASRSLLERARRKSARDILRAETSQDRASCAARVGGLDLAEKRRHPDGAVTFEGLDEAALASLEDGDRHGLAEVTRCLLRELSARLPEPWRAARCQRHLVEGRPCEIGPAHGLLPHEAQPTACREETVGGRV